jgi:hypothetical protein
LTGLPRISAYFIAPQSGIVRFSGQIWVVLDNAYPPPINPSYIVKIFKNAPCSNDPNQHLIAGIGAGSFWWAVSIPIDGEDLAAAGDVYRWCGYATAALGGDHTTYFDGNWAHTRVHVSMTP